MGLMQLMPSVAQEYKVRNAYDPAANIDAGVQQAEGADRHAEGDLTLALAAYNAGEGGRQQVQRHPAVPRDPELRVTRSSRIVGAR